MDAHSEPSAAQPSSSKRTLLTRTANASARTRPSAESPHPIVPASAPAGASNQASPGAATPRAKNVAHLPCLLFVVAANFPQGCAPVLQNSNAPARRVRPRGGLPGLLAQARYEYRDYSSGFVSLMVGETATILPPVAESTVPSSSNVDSVPSPFRSPLAIAWKLPVVDAYLYM